MRPRDLFGLEQHDSLTQFHLVAIVVTGIMAAGKSTVAQLLAERFARSVQLRGDAFRRMIVRGQAPITSPLSDEAVARL